MRQSVLIVMALTAWLGGCATTRGAGEPKRTLRRSNTSSRNGRRPGRRARSRSSYPYLRMTSITKT